MELLKDILAWARPLVPVSATVAGVLIVVFGLRVVLERRYAAAIGFRFRLQLFTLIATLCGILLVVLVLPVSDTTRGQLLSLFGILLTAAIALSSTTFIGNAMAGLMLRAVGAFRPGDFIRTGDHFGRVSEQGLFHVEIQTEDRDLTTLPNLFLVTNPYKVVRSSGTMITAEVSLGYDVPAARITRCLLTAAAAAGLKDPFVHILSLGDFAVVYRIAGLLTEVRHVLSARSRLREEMLAALHADGIEIVSPSFMNTRALAPGEVFIPPAERTEAAPAATARPAEAVVFDKADEAASLEKLRQMLESAGRDQKALEERLGAADETEKVTLRAEIERLEGRRTALAELIRRREESTG